jgi:hypothetical protein
MYALIQGQACISKTIKWFEGLGDKWSHGKWLDIERHESCDSTWAFRGRKCVGKDADIGHGYKDGTKIDLFHVPEETPDVVHLMRRFYEKTKGHKYDLSALFNFIGRRDWFVNSNKWFCYEWVFSCYQEAGVNLLERIKPYHVTGKILATIARPKVYYAGQLTVGGDPELLWLAAEQLDNGARALAARPRPDPT